jgi:hypothetical protein
MRQPNFLAKLELCLPNFMKPTSQISRPHSRLDEQGSSSPLRLNHPQTDYHFHAAGTEVKSGGGHKLTRPVFAPGFRDLSDEFLGAETKRNYVTEALFFAIIVGVSAWPIVSMVQALAQFVK